MSQELWEEEVAEWIRTVRHPTLTPRARKRIWREAWRRARLSRAFSLPVFVLRLRPVGIALLCVFALLLGSFGTVLAAQDSMPTDLLYPVKRASEEVWWAVVPAADRPTVALELALRRMEEVEYLLNEGETVPEELWDDLAGRLADAESMEDVQVPEHVRARLEHHLQILEQLMARHPDNPGLRRAMEASRQALEVLSGPPDVGHTPTPPVSPGPPQTPPGQSGEHGPPSVPPGRGEPPPWYRHRPTPPIERNEPPGPPSTPPGQGVGQGPPATPPGRSGDQGPPATPPGQGEEHGAPSTPPGQGEEHGAPTTPPGQGEEHGAPTTPPGQSGGQGPPSTPPGQGGKK
ncbi:MAG TPA: hypothetical protein G4O00_02300 [Thermoflexia bacterium]|nr:hypothetical protein [Thermoflexia bacterium]